MLAAKADVGERATISVASFLTTLRPNIITPKHIPSPPAIKAGKGLDKKRSATIRGPIAFATSFPLRENTENNKNNAKA